ncbi:MAG: protein kinase [Deltaproteobacteria bacterium]|nr:protein kinase [Deltaproteobacteria bacterium]
MAAEPSQFGPYELISRLGAGGMAETFLAVRRGPGGFEQRVCLKRILPAFEDDAEFVRLFMEEARIAATLRHANIVQVLDFGVADGSHFMALELIDGLDLRELLKALQKMGESITTGLVAHLAYELANALEYAHRADGEGQVQGVVHRDISPSNVLLSTAGEVKLADFGIAKAMDQTQVTRSGNIKGKVPYMAPEYALSAKYDARSDIFSLGVTLYECLAGERPFDGATELDTMRRVQEGLHTPLEERVPSASKALVSAIERSIATDRKARFANAADLQDALVDVAPPPTARRILGELVRRLQGEQPRGAPPKGRHDDDEGLGRRGGESLPDADDVAYAATMAGTPGGTLMLDADASGDDGHVVPAPASAETRTALPSARPGPATSETATTLDSAAAEARRVADAETRALPAEPKPDVEPNIAPARSAPEPPQRRAPRKGSLKPLLIVGGIVALGAVGLVVSQGTQNENAEIPRSPADAPPPQNGATPVATGAAAAPPSPSVVDPSAHSDLPSGVEAPMDDEGSEEANGDAVSETTMTATGPTGLVIGVLPYGEVWVDDRSYGSAPARVELRPGPHRVRVTGPNGFTAERRVRVNPGRMREVRFP